MNIIILGAGRVGESVAESLVSEQNDITVVDMDAARLRLLEDRLDLRGVVGNGIQPSVLKEAGAKDADMVIACAANDDTNLVVCKVAHDVFNIPSTIARLRSPEFVEGDALLGKSGFAVDHVICPEASVTRYIHQLVSYPEALQVLEFADGRASLIFLIPGSTTTIRVNGTARLTTDAALCARFDRGGVHPRSVIVLPVLFEDGACRAAGGVRQPDGVLSFGPSGVGGFVRQWQVEVSALKLRQYDVMLGEVMDAVAAANLNVGGKTIEDPPGWRQGAAGPDQGSGQRLPAGAETLPICP